MEYARSAAHSPYQSVSPAASIAVGVTSPSCSTATVAVLQLTATLSILPASCATIREAVIRGLN
jgi:hypothetical protein